MAVYTIQDTTLTDIADAIREKTGFAETIKPAEMADVINEMSILPSTALVLTGNQMSAFANNCWNWFIETYGDKITTKGITNSSQMFYNANNLTEIPFDINILTTNSSMTNILQDAFYGVNRLSSYPNIHITKQTGERVKLDRCCNKNRNVFFGEGVILSGFEYDAFNNWKQDTEPTWIFEDADWEYIHKDTSVFGTLAPVNWSGSYYIKTIPSMPKFYNSGSGSYYHHWYNFNIQGCYNLKEIVLPRPGNAVLTSSPNGFNMSNNSTLKHLVFDVQEDGTPYTANWKNITLTLVGLGWGTTGFSYLQTDKMVSNDEDYLRLKNDDEYWTKTPEYSGYNHDSAVETLNSLPDTSAYGTNTIKFRGIQGSKTDGGAINTLTEEEIAVATAKGWTVSLV